MAFTRGGRTVAADGEVTLFLSCVAAGKFNDEEGRCGIVGFALLKLNSIIFYSTRCKGLNY